MLMMISVVFVFSTGFFDYGGQKSPYGFLFSQSLFAIVGVVIIFAFQFLSRDACYRLLSVLFVVSLIACIILPFLPHSLVVETKGARRWLRIFGFSIAPLEFLKISMISLLALTYTRKISQDKKKVLEELVLLLPSILAFIIIFGYVYLTQNDLGQCVVCALVLLFMAFIAGLSFRIFAYLIIGGIALGLLAIIQNPRRLERILAWWGSVQDFILPLFPGDVQETLRIAHASEPYQISHSLNAISHGEWFGQGFGLGVFKLGFLSEVHTDFILAGIAEEIGFIGFFAVGCLFLFLALTVFKLAICMKSKRDFLFCSGYGFCLLVTFFMNLGGITSMIPLKGIAVPFLSYGGSSMIANSIAIGAVLCIFKNAGEKNNVEFGR